MKMGDLESSDFIEDSGRDVILALCFVVRLEHLVVSQHPGL